MTTRKSSTHTTEYCAPLPDSTETDPQANANPTGSHSHNGSMVPGGKPCPDRSGCCMLDSTNSAGGAPAISLFENEITLHVTKPRDDDMFDLGGAADFLKTRKETVHYHTFRTKELAHIPVGKEPKYFRRDLVAFAERRRVAALDEASSLRRKRP